jgi:hypothetical protein
MKKIKYYIPKDSFEDDDGEIADAITLTVYLKKPKNTDCYVLEVTPVNPYEGIDHHDSYEFYGW